MTTRDDIIKEIIEQEWTGCLKDFLPVTCICSDKDIEKYQALGYTQVIKADELAKIAGAGIDLNHIYYDKNGVPTRTVYFDEDNDIIMNLTLGKNTQGQLHFLYQSKSLNDDITNYVNWMKGLLSDKDYNRFIITTPRAYRKEILERLNKKDNSVTYEKYQGAIHFD